MTDAPRWHLAPGVPWRVARLGVVASAPAGTVVATDLAAEVLVRLPATTSDLAAALPDASADDLATALEHLASHGLVVPG